MEAAPTEVITWTTSTIKCAESVLLFKTTLELVALNYFVMFKFFNIPQIAKMVLIMIIKSQTESITMYNLKNTVSYHSIYISCVPLLK